MAIICKEKPDSPQYSLAGSASSARSTWLIMGTTDKATAMSTLQATAPTAFQDIPRRSVTVDCLLSFDPGVWLGTVQYGYRNVAETSGTSFRQFDTSGNYEHITQAIANIANYPSGAPDHKGAINVTDHGVEGVDVLFPKFDFTEIRFHDSIPSDYEATLYNLTRHVNLYYYMGYAPGELLFKGASGSSRGRDNYEIHYKFSASPNVTGYAIGDITGIDKKGQEYLWVEFEDQEDETAHRMVKIPRAVHVEQVYPYGNLELLDL